MFKMTELSFNETAPYLIRIHFGTSLPKSFEPAAYAIDETVGGGKGFFVIGISA